MADRVRKTNRFNFRGMNTTLLADSLPPGKYPLAKNARADGDSKIHSRPGYILGFATTASPVTDLKAYTTLGDDNRPRILAHDQNGQVYLDDGTMKSTVGSGGLGASMIPFRPNQSPQSWMYIWNGTGAQKLSAPNNSNAVTSQKIGIAEPQAMPEASPDGFKYNEFTGVAGDWTPTAPAGATSNVTRSTDVCNGVFLDPASTGASKPRWSAVVGTTIAYQIGETISMARSGGGSYNVEIEDVIPPMNGGTAVTIDAIYYFSGTSGGCVIVPSQMPVGTLTSTPTPITQPATTQTPQKTPALAELRRGSVVVLNSGHVNTESVYVLNVTVGPQMQTAFECVTVNTHIGGGTETIAGSPVIVVAGIDGTVSGQAITAAQINSVCGNGVGFLDHTLSTNPFNLSLGTFSGVSAVPQEDDLIHISLTVDVPGNVKEIKIIFDVGDGSFTESILWYAISASLVQQAVSNSITNFTLTSQLATNQTVYQSIYNQLLGLGYGSIAVHAILNTPNRLVYDPTTGQSTIVLQNGQQIAVNTPLNSGVGQYTEVTFPIRSLIPAGNDQTKTLANCGKVRLSVNVTGTTTFGFGSLWVGGGGQADVGVNGSPYYYRVVPRSNLTGATGNPSPATRYGVLPRLEQVVVQLPSASYDTQITNWDIYRYGGSVTSWRYIGTAASSATTYVDDILDSAALGGSEIEFDNFEPFPSVDQPYTATTGGGGNITSITVTGIVINLQGTSFPSTILRWLPGTLITLNGQSTYTLWARPVNVFGGVLLTILENAGSPTVSTLLVSEPIVANQMFPYIWGPDSAGIIYAAGDPLRPGTFQTTKPNNPDSCPNNAYDLTPSSEPLMGGEIIDGLSIIASSNRWWQLQPEPSTAKGVNPVEMPAGRGLAAPFGKCTDGKVVYFVAKDGVYAMVPNTPAASITDADIGNIFPIFGTTQLDIPYAGQVIWAVNYQYSALFRLNIVNNWLRFFYYDRNGFVRTLELDLNLTSEGQPRMAWAIAEYADPIQSAYQPEQPESTLSTANTIYRQCYFGDHNGVVWIERDGTDGNLPVHVPVQISVSLATPEQDYGDSRVNKTWLDAWIDYQADTFIFVTAVFQGTLVPPLLQQLTTLGARTQTLLELGVGPGSITNTQLGLLFQWSAIDQETWIFEWSSEFVPNPITIRTWKSIPTSHGLQGYHHIGEIRFAYLTADSNPVALTITSYDGTSPQMISLPGTNGVYQKTVFLPTFNKGLLYTYQGTHPTGWAPLLEDCEILVGQWERTGPYAVYRTLGGSES